MSDWNNIKKFIDQKEIAIVGISGNKKFGNAIFDTLEKKGYTVYPVSKKLDFYNHHKCYHSLAELPESVTGIVVAVNQSKVKAVVEEASNKGIHNVWLQQGSFPKEKLSTLPADGLNLIANRCIMMFAASDSFPHSFHGNVLKLFGKFPK